MINQKNRKPQRIQILNTMRIILEPWSPDIDDPSKITESTNLLTDLGMDSIGILQMLLDIEKEYDIKIKQNELDSTLASKIGNFINLIERKLNEAH